jgi:hypothetical protein
MATGQRPRQTPIASPTALAWRWAKRCALSPVPVSLSVVRLRRAQSQPGTLTTPTRTHHRRPRRTSRIGTPTPTPAPDQSTTAHYDTKIERYRAALDAGADPALIAGWITETQAERQRALARNNAIPQNPPEVSHLNAADIAAILDELGDLITALADAEPDHKLEVYRSLGLRLTYHPETQTVHAMIDLGGHRWDLVRVRGGT